MRSARFGICLRLLLLGYCLLFSSAPLMAQSATSGPEVIRAVHQDVSPALRDIPPAIPTGLLHEQPLKPLHPEKPFSGVPDGAGHTTPVLQQATVTSGVQVEGDGTA